MKRWMLVAGATVSSGVLVAIVAHAEAPAASAPAARPSSAALAATPVAVPADAPTLASEVPGTEKSKAPSAAEWASGRAVQLTRRGPRAESCGAIRVREWLRVRCQTPTFAISLLSGSNDGLAFWIGGEAEGRFGEVQLPLRRGDRRVVQLWANEAGVTSPSLVLQELWPEDDAAPTVTAL